jgi:apolipoprotein N-acyltransferase
VSRLRLTRAEAEWPLAVSAALAAASGAVLWAAFPGPRLHPLAALSVMTLLLAVRGRSARAGFALGLLAGAVFYLPHLAWLRVVGVNAWLVLSAVMAVFTAATGAALSLVTRLRGWPLWAPAVWVAQEAVRARVPFDGFTWGRLAFSQDDSPLTGWAAVGGAPLVTFLVALIGTLLAVVVVDALDVSTLFGRTTAARFSGAGLGALAVALSGLALPGPPAGERELVVAAVQGNVPRVGLDAFAQRLAVTRNHVEATSRLAADVAAGRVPAPELVVLPENTTDNDPRRDPVAAELLTTAARAVGQPILVGAVLDRDDGRLENAGLVWTPEGTVADQYVKQHLVPFGEFVPFRAQLEPLFGRLALVPRDFVPGEEPGRVDVGDVAVSDVICFEIAYDDLVRDAVEAGGSVLVVQTNNATYGRTEQPEQQFAITRLRAVEHGRPTVVAATSGVSGIIEADGDVIARSAEFTQDVLVATVNATTRTTIATRAGALPELLLAALGLVAVALAAARSVPVP